MADEVAINEKPTRLGGCTGKGFLPGKSGNPSGRPKRDLAAELAVRVFEKADFEKLASQIIQTIGRNPKMLQIVADRAFGKVPQTLNIQGELNVSTNVAERLKAARKRTS